MKKSEIINELKKGKSFSEIESIAEKLTYKVSYLKKTSVDRTRYILLHKEDLEKSGYKIFEIGFRNSKNIKEFENILLENGFFYTFDCYFNPKIKEAWAISYLPKNISIAIGDGEDYKNLEKLLSKEDYINLLADKIFELQNKWEEYKRFVNGLVEQKKRFFKKELEEGRRNDIIKQALEEAVDQNLIKTDL